MPRTAVQGSLGNHEQQTNKEDEDDLPFQGSSEACYGHGACVELKCACDEGFAGTFCELHTCPNDCSAHGKCNTTHTGMCTCGVGYAGEDCSTALTCEGK